MKSVPGKQCRYSMNICGAKKEADCYKCKIFKRVERRIMEIPVK